MAPDGWLPFFERLEGTAFGTAIRESLWAFPIIESIHLLGLCLLGGALLVVDLRLLGLGLTRQPIEGLIRSARPWLFAAIALMLATGIPMFLSEAVKCFYNTSFWVKMIALPIALCFTLAIRRRMAGGAGRETSLGTRICGLASIALWFTVAAAGRWIGYSG